MITPRVPFDNDRFLVANQLAGVVQTKHRRDAHTACQDGSVRSDAANVGNKGSELLILERHDVGRRKVVGDDNQVFSCTPVP